METFFSKLGVNKCPSNLIAEFLWMLLSINPQHPCNRDSILGAI